MFRYPDGTFRQTAPAKVEYNGYVRAFFDLTREQWDELGFNEAVPVARDPFTTYQTSWAKNEDLVYRETVVSVEIDETAKADAMAGTIRAERDGLLAGCDWTQLADSPLAEADKTAWAAYRQTLREVPQQAGFPLAVTWPAEPAA